MWIRFSVNRRRISVYFKGINPEVKILSTGSYFHYFKAEGIHKWQYRQGRKRAFLRHAIFFLLPRARYYNVICHTSTETESGSNARIHGHDVKCHSWTDISTSTHSDTVSLLTCAVLMVQVTEGWIFSYPSHSFSNPLYHDTHKEKILSVVGTISLPEY